MFGKNYLLPMFLPRKQIWLCRGRGESAFFPAFQYTTYLAQIINGMADYTNICYSMSVHRRQKSMQKRNKKDRPSEKQRAGHY